MPKPIYILNGPNLNLLGEREPGVYGHDTLADIEAACAARASDLGFEIEFRQTNSEGELVTWTQEAHKAASALVINPAAYGHTSIALYDALKILDVAIIEVHLSQPAAREAFRAHSYVAPAATGTVSGFGALSYVLGVEAAAKAVSATA